MRYYIIAGEASGDLHASSLIAELKMLDDQAEFRAWGGDLMQAQGATIVKHYNELAFMGFSKVIANLPSILRNLAKCKRDIKSFKPDRLILVDYPGFNLRIAKFAFKKGFQVDYYISPKVWAWNSSRVNQIKKYVTHMLTIFPFEKSFYEQFNIKVSYVGNPLVEKVDSFEPTPLKEFREKNHLDKRPIIALFPGSRAQEVRRMLPKMLEIVDDFSDYQFVIAAVPHLQLYWHTKVVNRNSLKILINQNYDLLKHAKAAIVTSGTATLEASLFKVPQLVCYQTDLMTYKLAKQLLKIHYISLVNIILDKEAVKELIQLKFHRTFLKSELEQILNDKEYVKGLKKDYRKIRSLLGKQNASSTAAAIIYKTD